jgi:hypothetical protein
MIDWDEDGDIEVDDIGLSAMMVDDLEKETLPRKRKGCFRGCFSAAILFLVITGGVFWILSMIP